MEEAFKINRKNKKVRNDNAVQGTNDSSILSKISMSQCGYFDDDFLKHFGVKIVRRSPLINRGYYIRAKVVDYVIQNFLRNSQDLSTPKQIINLGAGFDATFFRLKSHNKLEKTLFIEIDFPDVVKRKLNLIKSNERLIEMCSDLTQIATVNESVVYQSVQSNYILIGVDMRDKIVLDAFLKSIKNFDESAPTLLLSEVVLTYMALNSCNTLIEWINQTFNNCMMVVYEQVLPNDAFGQVMCSHFNKLGSPLKCILKYPTKEAQVKRYCQLGFEDCDAIQMIDFYMNYIDDEEKKRIERLESFDEYEPWHLKCLHYIMLIAAKGKVCSEIKQNLIMNNNTQLAADKIISVEVGVKEFPLKFGSRLGHSVAYDKKLNKIYVIGGFGDNIQALGRHKRQNSIEIIDLNKMSVELIENLDNFGERFFSSSFCFSDSGVLILFGRGSPTSPFGSIFFNDSGDVEKNYSIEKFEFKGDSDDIKLRWRHASCKLEDWRFVLHGGKCFNSEINQFEILNDFYVVSKNGSCQKISIDTSVLSARHTHSMCAWKDKVILSGGIGENERIHEEILTIDTNNFEIKKLEIKSGVCFKRYAHTSHIIDDVLILIGGVNYNITPGICFIDLNTLVACEYELPINSHDLSPIMLQNHQTLVISKDTIMMIGGGANCFSFGTHLNTTPVLLDISKCWAHFDSIRI